MKSSTAQPLHASYLPLLCLLTLHIVTGNYMMASATDMEADTGSKDATVFPDAREGVYSLSRKLIHEIPGKEDTPVRRKRSAPKEPYKPPVGLIVFLVILLVVIILALAFFYRRLNQETDGQYAPTKLLNTALECARNTGRAIDSRRRVLLRGHTTEDAEMGRQEDDDEEEEEEECREKESINEGESLAEDEQGEEDSSDDYSSLEGFCPGDGAMLKGRKGKRASQEKKEEKKAEVMDEKKEKEKEKKEGDEGRQAGEGLLADLKEFSGSAIWAEEKTNEVDTDKCDLTEL